MPLLVYQPSFLRLHATSLMLRASLIAWLMLHSRDNYKNANYDIDRKDSSNQTQQAVLLVAARRVSGPPTPDLPG